MRSCGKSERKATVFETVPERAETLPDLDASDVAVAVAELNVACFSIRLLKF